jgi:hypothetical protein
VSKTTVKFRSHSARWNSRLWDVADLVQWICCLLPLIVDSTNSLRTKNRGSSIEAGDWSYGLFLSSKSFFSPACYLWICTPNLEIRYVYGLKSIFLMLLLLAGFLHFSCKTWKLLLGIRICFLGFVHVCVCVCVCVRERERERKRENKNMYVSVSINSFKV